MDRMINGKMTRGRLSPLSLGALFLLSAAACGEGGSATVEPLPELQPNLPAVPQLPPAPYPVTYPDGSYSVYGIRRRASVTLGHPASVTGYIVSIYAPPECEGNCPRPSAPHFFLADAAGETDPAKQLLVAGYAESHDELRDLIRRGSRRTGENGEALPAIDFTVGNKVKVSGNFTHSAGGFNYAAGLIEYSTHETQQAVAAP
jgi:hypothetical protein